MVSGPAMQSSSDIWTGKAEGSWSELQEGFATGWRKWSVFCGSRCKAGGIAAPGQTWKEAANEKTRKRATVNSPTCGTGSCVREVAGKSRHDGQRNGRKEHTAAAIGMQWY